jgi:hypothetical protein
MRDYFKKKTDTIDGKEGSEAAKKDLLQILRKFKPFESILAAIRLMLSLPSVEMDLGARFTNKIIRPFSRNRSIYRLTLIKG